MAGLGVGKGKSKEMSIDDAVSIINSNLGEDPKGFFSPHEVALKALKPVSPAIKKLLTSDEARENGGQDHNVYYDPETKTWLKMTVAGRYGSQSKDTPVDYLQNLKRLDNLNNDALGYKVVGTIKNESGLPPSIVTRVNHIAGEHPKDEAERDAFLTTHGFTPVGYNKFTIPDGRGIIEDAHTQNVKVVNHPEGGTFPMFIDGWVQPNE